MTALLAVLGVRFNALPFKLIACAGVSLTLVLGLVMIYREGRHSAERAATIGLAKHNAEIAAKYMRDTEAQPAEPEGHSDLEAAMYLIDTRAAGADCRSKLQAVRETLEVCRGSR